MPESSAVSPMPSSALWIWTACFRSRPRWRSGREGAASRASVVPSRGRRPPPDLFESASRATPHFSSTTPRISTCFAEVVLPRATPIGPAHAVARGHEFHYSTLDPVPAGIERVYRVAQRGAPARAEGYLVGRTLMSYIHLHFASNPELPRAFVAACAGSRA